MLLQKNGFKQCSNYSGEAFSAETSILFVLSVACQQYPVCFTSFQNYWTDAGLMGLFLFIFFDHEHKKVLPSPKAPAACATRERTTSV